MTAGGTAAPSSAAPSVAVAVIPENLKVYSAEGAPVIAEPSEATTFATLHVPRWGYDYVKPISEGTDRQRVLDPLGIGHYKGTSMPGAVGNFAIAGHRTTYGKPFSDINTLQVGDSLVVQTEVGLVRLHRDRSRHRESQLHGRDRARARKARRGAQRRVHHPHVVPPEVFCRQRYIVWGKLKYWAPTGNGYPSELLEKP